MNRRDFLLRASLSVAALAIDPEQLLWTPGRRTFIDLGPLKYRVMWGDWFAFNPALNLYERTAVVGVNGTMHAATILATPFEMKLPNWSQVEAIRKQRLEAKLYPYVKDMERRMRTQPNKNGRLVFPMT